MREAYRLNKHTFYQYLQDQEQQIALMFIYLGKESPDHIVISKKLVLCLMELQQKITKTIKHD